METGWSTFRTKREASAWLRDCERRNTTGRNKRVVPASEIPSATARARAEALGHRWAMLWEYTPDRLRIPGLSMTGR